MTDQEGYIEHDIAIDGVYVGTEIYDTGHEEESEAFLEGMIMIAKMTPQEVVITTQFHGHPMLEDDEECQCAQYCDGDNNNYAPIWSNHD